MEADYGMTDMAFNMERGKQFDQDANLLVHFQNKPHMDKAESAVQGRPIFKPREYITIIVPGDKTNIVNRPVWEQDRRRFPKQYSAFLNNKSQESEGTPLETVPWLTREQVEEMKYFNVKTLEHLANMPDAQAQRFMGIQTLRTRARDQIQAAKDLAPQAALRAEVEKQELENKQLRELITALTAKVAKLEVTEEEE